MPKSHLLPIPGPGALCLFLSLAVLAGCVMTARDWVDAGHVVPDTFDQLVPFLQFQDTVVIEASLDGENGRYLLDTAANISLIDGNSEKGMALPVTGAGGREQRMQAVQFETLSIGAVHFHDTYGAAGDLADLARAIPEFRGLMGQPILRKADWAIDYHLGELRIGSALAPDPEMREVPVHYRLGLPHVVLEIDAVSVEAVIDSGAATYLALPEDSPTAARLQKSYEFSVRERQIFTVTGVRRVSELRGVLPAMKVGDVLLRDVPVEIRDTDRARLGAGFLAAQGRVLLKGGGNIWLAQ